MKHDRSGGKRTNWLLIKHADANAREGEGEAALAQDRSVASGRSMEDIAAGKGRKPKPFMLDASLPAVWQSNRQGEDASPEPPPKPAKSAKKRAEPEQASAPEKGKHTRAKPAEPKQATAATSLPTFIEPQLCTSLERPPSGADWAHEVKFDGYRLQLRVRVRQRRAAHPQGSRLDGQIRRDRAGRSRSAGLHHRRRGRGTGPQWRAGFRGPAGRALRRAHGRSRVLRLRPSRRRPGGSARAASRRAQEPAQDLARGERTRRGALPAALRRAFHGGRRCDPARRLPHVARGHRIEAARRPLSLGPHGKLDQIEMPRRP